MSILLISDLLLLAAYGLAFFVAWNRWRYRVMLSRLEKKELASTEDLPENIRNFLGGSSRIEGVTIFLSMAAAVSSKVLEVLSRGGW